MWIVLTEAYQRISRYLPPQLWMVVSVSDAVEARIALVPVSRVEADDQVTTYDYGVTTSGGSALASNDLLYRVIYPDSADSTDNVQYKYNRQGQITEMRDQNGSVHTFDYDKLGRQTHDRVTTLASGVDGAVLRISTTYDVRGLVERITSYDNATAGSGNVVNEVQNAYNDFGQLETQYQAHAGAVNTSTSPKVEYAYTDGSSNYARPTKITYPSGRIVRYEYTSGADDNLSRISYLADDAGGSVGTHLAEYTYLGMGMVVKVDYPEPDIRMDLAHGAGADPYEGLDRFGRVQDLLWRNYGTSTDAVRIKHGYDRASNRLYREDPVAAANGKHFDELYTYDGMYQLKDMQRGQLNGTKDGISTGTLDFAQDWAFDALGNWTQFKEDDNGDGTWDLDQTRTHNEVNEITGISETAGPAWPTPAYDRNGNMSSMPQPLSPTASYTATWDAWNRLVKLADGSDTVAEHQYDGQKWRTVSKSYTAGVLSETRQQYYSSQWQLVEERVGSSTDPDQQFVWGLRYIDDLVLRDRDTNADGTLDERLYAMQDPNWNVVAVASTGGAIQERYAYEPYGAVTKLNATFGASSATIQWNEVLYGGYRYDATTGLCCVRYRYYHLELGRWASRDEMKYAGGVNHYSYGPSATSVTDPFGLIWTWPRPVDVPPWGKWPHFNPVQTIIDQINRRLQKLLHAAKVVACDIANMTHMPAIADLVTCGCFGAGALDMIPLLTNIPGVEAVDCYCNLLTSAQTACNRGGKMGAGYLILTVADCASLPLGALLAGAAGTVFGAGAGGTAGTAVEPGGGTVVGGAGGAAGGGAAGVVLGDAIVDISMFLGQNYLSQGTVLPDAQVKACCNTIRRGDAAMRSLARQLDEKIISVQEIADELRRLRRVFERFRLRFPPVWA